VIPSSQIFSNKIEIPQKQDLTINASRVLNELSDNYHNNNQNIRDCNSHLSFKEDNIPSSKINSSQPHQPTREEVKLKFVHRDNPPEINDVVNVWYNDHSRFYTGRVVEVLGNCEYNLEHTSYKKKFNDNPVKLDMHNQTDNENSEERWQFL
jgi:secreted trypsin-like serine protease